MNTSLLIADAHALQLLGECHLLLLGLLGIRGGYDRLDFRSLCLLSKALSLFGFRIVTLDLPLLGLSFGLFFQVDLVLVLLPAFRERVLL